MDNKTPCIKCGAMILFVTAEATGGLCMPCKNGYRKNIERSKEYYQKQREYDPFRELWDYLLDKVYEAELGFEGLSIEEKLYFSINMLNGEVYNGGMDQFFFNSSGAYYQNIIDGLLELKAFKTLSLLTEAKEILFGSTDVSADRATRYESMKKYPDEGVDEIKWCVRLEAIDKSYWEDPDQLNEKLRLYAESKGLVDPFKKQSA